MNLKLEYLKTNEFPEKKIYNQVVRLHLPNGGINVDTWKYCVNVNIAKRLHSKKKVKEFQRTDTVFDKIASHKAFIIRDKETNKVVSWALLVTGYFYEHPYEKMATIQFYSRPNIRGQGLGSKMFNECEKQLIKMGINTCYYYPCNANKWFFHKMKKRSKSNIEYKNIYKDVE